MASGKEGREKMEDFEGFRVRVAGVHCGVRRLCDALPGAVVEEAAVQRSPPSACVKSATLIHPLTLLIPLSSVERVC